jgi:hypothetical protein
MKKFMKAFLVLFLTLAGISAVHATDYTWVGTTNAWATSTNWSPAAPAGGPTAADNVIIGSVILPKRAPVIGANVSINNLTITSGQLTINSAFILTVNGSINISGSGAKITGANATIKAGTASTKVPQVIIGGPPTGIVVDPSLVIYTAVLNFTNTTFRKVTAFTDDLTISGGTISGISSITKRGTSTASINGTVTCTTTVTFVNEDTGSLLIGNSDLDNITFSGAATFTNSGTGSILFGNTDNDVFVFKGATVFNKAAGSLLEVARFGNTEFYANVTYNAPAGEVPVFGSTGGGQLFFKGAAQQRLSSTSGVQINKITIDKTGSFLELYTPVTLVPTAGAAVPEPRLNLLNGNINTGNNTAKLKLLTLTENTVVTLNADPNKSFINGALQRSGATAFTFPIGRTKSYRPVVIGDAVPGESLTFTAEYFLTAPQPNANVAADIPTLSSCEYWKITKDQGAANAKITLTWADVGCEAVQTIGLKFCRFNTTSNKWETVPATQNDPVKTLVSESELTTYGNFTLGYAAKRLLVNTTGLDPVTFTATGAQLSPTASYTSGGSVSLLPIPPASGTSTILLSLAAGNENLPIKISFDIDNASNITNVAASMDNGSVFLPMDPEFFLINNAPANGKSIQFLKGEATPAPVFTTNLVNGTVFNNSGTNTFKILGTTGLTITGFKILSLDNSTIVKGPLTVATWDGTNQANAEVSPGVYKFELTVKDSNAKSFTYGGQLIVK